MLERRRFLAELIALGLSRSETVQADVPFDPAEWLRRRRLGRLTTVTPQAGKPLQPLAARSLDEWEKERTLYATALRELIGAWPGRRPPLQARESESREFPSYTRLKVSFSSLPSQANYASEIRAWMLIPKGKRKPLPALITLHQTVPQGKDEPAGIQASLPWMAMAKDYVEQGYVTLAPDMIGYGERTNGGYARTGFELADAAPILNAHPDMTLLGLMLFDVSRAVDFLAERPEVDPRRIGVMGHSLGGILVNFILGLEPRLRVGIASCGYGLFRKDQAFDGRWASTNSAYLPRMHLYKKDRDALPLDFLQIMALAAPRGHLVQTAMGDSIWTLPAVADDAFVAAELRRIRSFYGQQAEEAFRSIQVAEGARDRDHGWYPEGQRAARELLAKVLQ